jgi:hypothetical protein
VLPADSRITVDRILKRIAAFSEERASRSLGSRMFKKQSDADDIKKWEKEITRAYENFNVSNGVCM